MKLARFGQAIQTVGKWGAVLLAITLFTHTGDVDFIPRVALQYSLVGSLLLIAIGYVIKSVAEQAPPEAEERMIALQGEIANLQARVEDLEKRAKQP